MSFDIEQMRLLYKTSWKEHGPGPGAVLWSEAGQRLRHEKLSEIKCNDSDIVSVLDLGCGLGDLYDTLKLKWPSTEIHYHGIDIVEEFIQHGRNKHRDAHFSCIDILNHTFNHSFDYVIMSGMFNNSISDITFLKHSVSWSFERCNLAIGFDFISSYADFKEDSMSYYDPIYLTKWATDSLSRKVRLDSHFLRANAAIFIYR